MNEIRPTLVPRGASIGANATIVCGTTIGEYAFIGAGAVVTKGVAPYALVYGNPARMGPFVCCCSVKLTKGEGRIACAACGTEYQGKNGRLAPVERAASESNHP